MSAPVDLTEFLSAYIVEAEEHLGAANAQLLAVDSSLRMGETNPRSVRELFRALHTIKGLSAMVGVEPVVALSHRMESILRTADRAGGALALPAIDLLLQGIRAIEQRVHALAHGQPVPPPPAALLEALESLEPSEAPARVMAATIELDLEPGLASKLAPFERDQLVRGVREGRRAARVDFVPSPARASEGLSITSVRERVGKIAEIVKVLPISLPATDRAPAGLSFAMLLLTAADDATLASAAGMTIDCVHTLARLFDAPVATAMAKAEPLPPEDDLEFDSVDTEPQRRGVVRVTVDRLDEAMERLSALIVSRARLAREVAAMTAKGVDTRNLVQIAQDSARQLRDLRAAILRLRMVPVADVLERVPLIVRAMRRTSGKSVRLELDAGRSELDKGVAERIFPAILHLVRNAIDHAIESPEERRRLGKPEEAFLRITCFARSNTQLELSVIDDGRGVDREAVAKRAGREIPVSDMALLQLLCRPGLSTRERANTTSGRGMGMDIVRRITVDQLGGELLLKTTPGVGTTFTMRVPLTISIVDAFTFECGSHRFVVPLSMIDEIVDVDTARVVHGPTPNGATGTSVGLLKRRGAALPLVALETALGLAASALTQRKALVVRRDGEALAFAVDRMLGQQEIVVRPLEDPMLKIPGVSGATDLGDGRPTLVLDLFALGATVTGKRTVESPS